MAVVSQIQGGRGAQETTLETELKRCSKVGSAEPEGSHSVCDLSDLVGQKGTNTQVLREEEGVVPGLE